MPNTHDKKQPSWKHIIQSVLSAFIGVQNQQHAEKDFQQGSWLIYGVVGIIMVLIFIGIIVGIVKWVLA